MEVANLRNRGQAFLSNNLLSFEISARYDFPLVWLENQRKLVHFEVFNTVLIFFSVEFASSGRLLCQEKSIVLLERVGTSRPLLFFFYKGSLNDFLLKKKKFIHFHHPRQLTKQLAHASVVIVLATRRCRRLAKVDISTNFPSILMGKYPISAQNHILSTWILAQMNLETWTDPYIHGSMHWCKHNNWNLLQHQY